jgi:hypothetical protein
MAGLDSIKGYKEGSDVEVDTTDTTTAPLNAQAVKSSGPYALPTVKGVGGVDPSLLENMRQLIAEREAQRSGILEGLKDATAWWSGGVAGPAATLAARDAQREAQTATTFGMKRDLAQYEVAQQRAKALQGQLFGSTPAAAPSAATAQGQAAQPGAAPAAAPAPQTGLLGLVKDPGLRQSIAVQAQDDQAGALKSIQSYLAANAKDPDIVKKVNYMLNNNMIDKSMVPQIMLTEAIGSGALIPHDIRGVAGTSQTTPFGSAGALVKPSAPAPAPAANLLPNKITPIPRVAAPPLNPVASTAAAPTPAPAMAPAAAPAMAPAAAPAVAPELQPLVSPALKTGFAPGSKEDLDIKAAAGRQAIENRGEQEKPIQKGAGESAVQLTSAAGNAKNNITEYDMAENILKKYPKAFGIAQDGSATAAVIQLVKPGTTIPILGTVKSEGIEEAVAQKSLPKKAIEARNIFNAIATRQGVEYAKNNLTGEGRGTLSNADMKMAQVAKGLSTDSPAASNLIFTVLNRENEMMILQRAEDWKKYQAEARSQGYQADFNRFKETPEYTRAMADKDARVRKRFPEFFKAEEAAAPGGKKSAKDFFK